MIVLCDSKHLLSQKGSKIIKNFFKQFPKTKAEVNKYSLDNKSVFGVFQTQYFGDFAFGMHGFPKNSSLLFENRFKKLYQNNSFFRNSYSTILKIEYIFGVFTKQIPTSLTKNLLDDLLSKKIRESKDWLSFSSELDCLFSFLKKGFILHKWEGVTDKRQSQPDFAFERNGQKFSVECKSFNLYTAGLPIHTEGAVAFLDFLQKKREDLLKPNKFCLIKNLAKIGRINPTKKETIDFLSKVTKNISYQNIGIEKYREIMGSKDCVSYMPYIFKEAYSYVLNRIFSHEKRSSSLESMDFPLGFLIHSNEPNKRWEQLQKTMTSGLKNMQDVYDCHFVYVCMLVPFGFLPLGDEVLTETIDRYRYYVSKVSRDAKKDAVYIFAGHNAEHTRSLNEHTSLKGKEHFLAIHSCEKLKPFKEIFVE